MGESVIKLVGALASVNKKKPAGFYSFLLSVCLRREGHDSSCLWLLEAQTPLPPKLNDSLFCELAALTPPSWDCCFHVLSKNGADPLIYCSMMEVRLTAERSFWQRCVQLQSLRYMHMFLWYLVARNARQIWLFGKVLLQLLSSTPSVI